MRGRSWCLLALLGSVLGSSPLTADDGVPIPGDDFVVEGPVKIRPGTYRIADANGDGVIHVKGDGTKLDLTGVTLIGAADGALADTFAGVGISVDNAKDVTISSGEIRGFKIGVRVHDCPAAKLAGINASGNYRQHLRSTVEREDESDWLWGHENDDGHWERDYGAGIALKNSPGATVERCVVRNGQNGVLVDRCDRAQVCDGDFSFNSGWGIALWRTCDAVVCRNRADFCVRGYSHGRYARGQDSAGILVFEQCSRNTFALNSATHGGDGFFLYAGNETLKKTGEGGCNDNVVFRNDFSHAVANGIEATFSRGNKLVENAIADCEHGIWAGYSYETLIVANHIFKCRNGISIEHGSRNRIVHGSVVLCGTAIHLWARDDPVLAATAFGRKRQCPSSHNVVEANNFLYSNRKTIVLENDIDSVMPASGVNGTKPEIETTGTCIYTLDDGTSYALSKGYMGVPVAGWELKRTLRLPGNAVLWRDARAGKDQPFIDDDCPVPPVQVGTNLSDVLVDDWGPIPPTETRLFPAAIDAVGSAKFSALGVDKTFEVTSLTEGFVAEPMTGDLPATISVRRTDGGLAPKPFEVTVRCGADVRKARGTVASMPWDVRFFRWTKDPREDAAAWKALLAGEPAETRRTDGLDFDWKGGAVSEKVGADRFGTLATCEVETTAGKWRLATVSDDGIRVWVDGKLVVDDWTHHGPTPHDAVLDLAAGKHAIRVEHFEIDGWAALRVSLAPVRE